MTRFPRQLAVAVVVLFAFTFLSGCGSNKEDDKEETNNDASHVVTPDDNGDTQPQPDKNTCTVRKNDTKIVSDDGSGGKLTGKNCKQKNAKLKVGDTCEFECEDRKDYNKTGHIKCGKDGKIENTAKCNRTDEKKKADEEAEDKKSIVQLLITLVGPGKDNAVQRFIDMKAKGKADGWDNIKEKFKLLDKDEELKKELKKQFVNWEIEREKDTATKSIISILRKESLLRPYKDDIKLWVNETVDLPIRMHYLLANAATKNDTVEDCKHKIEKWRDIRLLSVKMFGVIGYGIKNEQKGKIKEHLRELHDLSLKAKKIREASNISTEVERLVKDYCKKEIKSIMREEPTPLNGFHQAIFDTFVDTKDVGNLLRMHRDLLKKEKQEVTRTFVVEHHAIIGIQGLLPGSFQVQIRAHCTDDTKNQNMIREITDAINRGPIDNAVQREAAAIVRPFVQTEILKVLTQGHLVNPIKNYVETRATPVHLIAIANAAVGELDREIARFAIYLADQNRALPPAAAGKIITEDRTICNNWIKAQPNIVNVVNVADIATFLTNVQNHL